MKNARPSWRGGMLCLVLVAGAATVAYAQFGGGGVAMGGLPMEYTMQEVDKPSLSQAMNDLGKERWDVFQVVPVWVLTNEDGETQLKPRAYQILARRPSLGTRGVARPEAK